MASENLSVVYTFCGHVCGGHTLYWSADNHLAVLGCCGIYIFDPDILSILQDTLYPLTNAYPFAALTPHASPSISTARLAKAENLCPAPEKQNVLVTSKPLTIQFKLFEKCHGFPRFSYVTRTCQYAFPAPHEFRKSETQYSFSDSLQHHFGSTNIPELPVVQHDSNNVPTRKIKKLVSSNDKRSLGRVSQAAKRKTVGKLPVSRECQQVQAGSSAMFPIHDALRSNKETLETQRSTAQSCIPGAVILRNYHSVDSGKAANRRFSVFAWLPPLKLNSYAPPLCLYLVGTSDGSVLELHQPQNRGSSKEPRCVFDLKALLVHQFQKWLFSTQRNLGNEEKFCQSSNTCSQCLQRPIDTADQLSEHVTSTSDVPLAQFLVEYDATKDRQNGCASSLNSFFQWIHHTLGGIQALIPSAAAATPNNIALHLLSPIVHGLNGHSGNSGCLFAIAFDIVVTLWWITDHGNALSLSPRIICIGSVQLPRNYYALQNASSVIQQASFFDCDLVTAVALSPLFPLSEMFGVILYLGSGQGGLFAYTLVFRPPCSDDDSTAEVHVLGVEPLIYPDETPITAIRVSTPYVDIAHPGRWTMAASACQYLRCFLGYWERNSFGSSFNCQHQHAVVQSDNTNTPLVLSHEHNITGLQCISTTVLTDSAQENGLFNWVTRIEVVDQGGALSLDELAVCYSPSNAKHSVELRCTWRGNINDNKILVSESLDQNANQLEPQLCPSLTQIKKHIPRSISQQKKSALPRVRGLAVSTNGGFHCVVWNFLEKSNQFSVTGGLLDLAYGSVPSSSLTETVLKNLLEKHISPLLHDVNTVANMMTSRVNFSADNFFDALKCCSQSVQPFYWSSLRHSLVTAAESYKVLNPFKSFDDSGPPTLCGSQSLTRRCKAIANFLYSKESPPESFFKSFRGSPKRYVVMQSLISYFSQLTFPWEDDFTNTSIDRFVVFFTLCLDRVMAADVNSSSWTYVVGLVWVVCRVLKRISTIVESIRVECREAASAKARNFASQESAVDIFSLLCAYIQTQLTRSIIALWCLTSPSDTEDTENGAFVWWSLKKMLWRGFLRASRCIPPTQEVSVFSNPEALRQNKIERLLLCIETKVAFSETCPYCDALAECSPPYTVFACRNALGASHCSPMSTLTMAPYRGGLNSWGCKLCGHGFEWDADQKTSPEAVTPVAFFAYNLPQRCPVCCGNTFPLNRY